MTRYLLDTSTLIDFSKGREPTMTRLLELIEGGDELGVCAISVAEFYSGLPVEQEAEWNEFFEQLVYWDISRSTAMHAGRMRQRHAGEGFAHTTADVLIAALAEDLGATVLTENVKDFPEGPVKIASLRSPGRQQ